MEERKRKLRKSSRVVVAFVVGPAAAAGAVAILSVGLGLLLGAEADELPIVFGGMLVAMLALGYVVAIILGVPGYLLFRRREWVVRRHWFLLGAAIGVLSGALFTIGGWGNPRGEVGRVFLFGVAIALVSAATNGAMFAWLIRPKGPGLDEVVATFD